MRRSKMRERPKWFKLNWYVCKLLQLFIYVLVLYELFQLVQGVSPRKSLLTLRVRLTVQWLWKVSPDEGPFMRWVHQKHFLITETVAVLPSTGQITALSLPPNNGNTRSKTKQIGEQLMTSILSLHSNGPLITSKRGETFYPWRRQSCT